MGYYFKVTAAICCSLLRSDLIWYYPFRSKIANAYPKTRYFQRRKYPERAPSETKEQSSLSEKLLKAIIDLSSQILGDPQLLLRALERQLWKESLLAWIQVCLCTACKSSHYYRKFLQDSQILFENHRFKTHPPVNKSFTVKYTQEVSQSLFFWVCSLS